MAAGEANVTVECNPLLGPQFFDVCKELKAGKQWINGLNLMKEFIVRKQLLLIYRIVNTNRIDIVENIYFGREPKKGGRIDCIS